MSANDSGLESGDLPVLEDHAELLIQGGARDGETVLMTSPVLNMGRHQENDLVIEDPSVSRRHARIVREDEQYLIRDLGSTNGTLVNSDKVTDDRALVHGDTIQLGGSEISLVFRHFSSGARTIKVAVLEPEQSGSDVEVNQKTRQVFVHGQALEPALPRKEFDLIMLLASRRGEAVSRDEIAQNVWPERPDGDVGNHEIEQCVHRVRARIEDDTSNPAFLVTIRGYGYRLF